MIHKTPLTSYEVRWFFRGPVARHPLLETWLMRSSPFARAEALDAPVWHGRLDDKPDQYLVLPGSSDMGIKWRDGELQVKGRMESLGMQHFGGVHVGHVERWIKWSYADLPDAYQDLFHGDTVKATGVTKSRAMRKFHLDPFGAEPVEVAVDSQLDRGLGLELTDISVDGHAWTSLGFEAFPDDSAMPQHFIAAVDAVLATLSTVELREEMSLSYPGWLESLPLEPAALG